MRLGVVGGLRPPFFFGGFMSFEVVLIIVFLFSLMLVLKD